MLDTICWTRIFWMKMGIFLVVVAFFIVSNIKISCSSLFHLCPFPSLLLAISLTCSLGHKPHCLMIQPIHWWLMMSWCSILCLVFLQGTRNIFQYQYSACAAVVVVVAATPIPIFGSIYRRAKCAKRCKLISFYDDYLFNSLQFYYILNDLPKLNFKGTHTHR